MLAEGYTITLYPMVEDSKSTISVEQTSKLLSFSIPFFQIACIIYLPIGADILQKG